MQSSFKKIKEWKLDDGNITLSLQSNDLGVQQLFLNRQRKRFGYENESGVEIPFEFANPIALWLFRQTTENAYVKGTCEKSDVGKKGDYTFETIKKFNLSDGKIINLKLMYNNKETKLFLNRQHGAADKGNEGGVEIPHTLALEIALYLRKSH